MNILIMVVLILLMLLTLVCRGSMLVEFLVADEATIESLTFQRFDPHASAETLTDPQSIVFKGYRDTSSSNYVVLQNWGSLYSISERAAIAEVMPHVRQTYAVDEGGYLVCAKLAGIEAYSYFFLPATEAPASVVKAVG